MFGRILISFIFTIVLVGISPWRVSAQEPQTSQNYEAKVTKILMQEEVEVYDKKQLYQKLELQILSSKEKGKKIEVEIGNIPVVHQHIYKVGDTVIVSSQKDPEGKDFYYITDYVRRTPLYVLGFLFVLLTLFVARKVGIKALLGMLISFVIIFVFILPQLLAGANPVWVMSIASLLIVPIIFYTAHGFNKTTTISIISTLIALSFTIILSNIFINWAKISGFASEEAGFLQASKSGALNIRGLVLASIMVGSIGILDDITVAQATIVQELKKTAKHLTAGELYQKAMVIGQNHIASMVNTLILVYTGASLPLLLLFVNNPHPITEIINYEVVAEEIIRTLVASLGLILAVPITTYLAASYFSSKDEAPIKS